MHGALTVRVNAMDGLTDRVVTQYVRGLRFRKTAPGGFASASCTIVLPRSELANLGPSDRFYVYDARTGRTVWDGYTENPGTSDGPEGQSFDLSAMGGTVLASDRTEKAVYADTDHDQWLLQLSASSATVQTDDSGDLACAFNSGAAIGTGSQAEAIYKGLTGSSQFVGSYSYTWTAGKTDANYKVEDGTGQMDRAGVGTGGFAVEASATFVTTGGTVAKTPADFGDSQNYVIVRAVRTGGATNVADELTWVRFHNLTVNARMLTATGALASATQPLTASAIAADIVGRLLSSVDPVRVSIDATTEVIDQLAYRDGANAGEIFDDLALHEPDYYWGIGASNAAGLHEFWFRAWPTEVRYEISVRDGYNAPGGDTDLCNRIAVFWTDAKGQDRVTLVGQYVQEIGNRAPVDGSGVPDPAFVGRIKDSDPVTLPEGRGSAANAQRVGAAILATKASASKAATAVVARPITDLFTGLEVMPWEINPGYPTRVRETGDVLRLTEVEYIDDDCAATLTLGTPTLTSDQILARVKAT